MHAWVPRALLFDIEIALHSLKKYIDPFHATGLILHITHRNIREPEVF